MPKLRVVESRICRVSVVVLVWEVSGFPVRVEGTLCATFVGNQEAPFRESGLKWYPTKICSLSASPSITVPTPLWLLPIVLVELVYGF